MFRKHSLKKSAHIVTGSKIIWISINTGIEILSKLFIKVGVTRADFFYIFFLVGWGWLGKFISWYKYNSYNFYWKGLYQFPNQIFVIIPSGIFYCSFPKSSQ